MNNVDYFVSSIMCLIIGFILVIMFALSINIFAEFLASRNTCKKKKIVEYFVYYASDKQKHILREEVKKIKFKKKFIKLFYYKKGSYFSSRKINYNCFISIYEEKYINEQKNINDEIPF